MNPAVILCDGAMVDFFKKPIVKKGILLLVIVALAVAAEFCYVALTRSELEYERAEYSAADFSSWEIEDRGNGEYYMLAYNSYFEKTDFGGVPVQVMEIRFTRGADDATEMVLYYKGTKDGVYGEFPAPINKVTDGVYTATLNIESLEAVKIYPTEKVRSTITFSGIVINGDVTNEAFTAARIILWAILLTTIYLLYSFVAKLLSKRIKLPWLIEFSVWTNVYIIMAAIVALAVFQATRMFSGVEGAVSVMLPAAVGGFTLLYLIVWLAVVRIKKIETKVAIVVVTIGVIFSFASAPMQAPDEHKHFMRAYAISQGDFGFYTEHEFPDDVHHLNSCFPSEYHNNVLKTKRGTTVSSLREYINIKDTPYTGEKQKTSMQVVAPYIPAAAGMLIVRIFGGGALACLYAGRIFNVLTFAVCAYFSLKAAERYRGALMAMILTPLTLFMAASTSYDAVFLACVVLFFGFILKKELWPKDIIALAAVFAVIVCIKPIYLPLALCILLVPKEAVKTKISRWWAIAIVAGLALLANQGTLLYASLFGDIVSDPKLPGVDVSAQIVYVLRNPIRYIMVMLVDAYQKAFYIPSYGIFGWLDVETVFTALLTPIVFVVVGALYADDVKTYKKNDILVQLATAVLVYVVVVTGFYAAWSTLGSTDILGVQARYFIPIIPCVVSMLSFAMSPALRFRAAVKDRELMRDEICVYMCGAAAFVGAAELLLNYFIM